MQNYIQDQKEKTGIRLTRILSILELESSQFAKLTNLAANTILNIEKGKGFNSNTLLTISFYTGLSLSELLNFDSFEIKENELKKTFWKNIENYNYTKYLNYQKTSTTINDVIQKLINETTFFSTPKKTGEVKKKIKKDYSLDLTSSSISQALSDLVKNGILKKEKLSLRNYVYFH